MLVMLNLAHDTLCVQKRTDSNVVTASLDDVGSGSAGDLALVVLGALALEVVGSAGGGGGGGLDDDGLGARRDVGDALSGGRGGSGGEEDGSVLHLDGWLFG